MDEQREVILEHWGGRTWQDVRHIVDALGDCVVEGNLNMVDQTAAYLRSEAREAGLQCRLLGKAGEWWGAVFTSRQPKEAGRR